MKKYIIITLGVLAGVGLFSAGVAYSQFWGSTAVPVVYFTKMNQDIMWKSLVQSKNDDQAAFVTDVGLYNIGMNTQHRVTPEPHGPQGGIRFHADETEIYYIVSGSGTLVTQTGVMTNVHPTDYSHDDSYFKKSTTTNLGNAPSGYADFSDPPVTHKVGPGDWVIIPPFTGHYLSEINGHVDYITVRVDPYHSMPAGYINPTLKAAGIKTFAVH